MGEKWTQRPRERVAGGPRSQARDPGLGKARIRHSSDDHVTAGQAAAASVAQRGLTGPEIRLQPEDRVPGDRRRRGLPVALEQFRQAVVDVRVAGPVLARRRGKLQAPPQRLDAPSHLPAAEGRAAADLVESDEMIGVPAQQLVVLGERRGGRALDEGERAPGDSALQRIQARDLRRLLPRTLQRTARQTGSDREETEQAPARLHGAGVKGDRAFILLPATPRPAEFRDERGPLGEQPEGVTQRVPQAGVRGAGGHRALQPVTGLVGVVEPQREPSKVKIDLGISRPGVLDPAEKRASLREAPVVVAIKGAGEIRQRAAGGRGDQRGQQQKMPAAAVTRDRRIGRGGAGRP